MVSPKQERINIKKQILAVLERDKEAHFEILTAQIALEYGLKQTTIKEIIRLMSLSGALTVEGNKITPKK
tara:strand:+ start:7546 stop:7755 length:210 start_codon:yes stop_codon:yes gene_type:complete